MDNNQTIKRRRAALAILVATALGLAGAVVLVLTLGGDETPRYVSETSSITATASVPPRSDVAAAVGTPGEAAGAITRLLIPRIGVDAPIVNLGVDPDGTMQAPATPTDVAWYRFSAKPGRPGNVVMAGHVNYIGHGPAVFARLTELQPGDEVLLQTDAGRFAYRVLSLSAHEDRPDEVARAVGPTDTEVVTLITCTGAFDRATGLYDRRLVVRAERLTATGR